MNPSIQNKPLPFWVPVLCAASIFVLAFGVRQSLALFIGPINTNTGLGLGAISLAFGFGQLMWGITQPISGALADKFGNAKVMLVGAVMVAAGTALIPFMHSLSGLIFAMAILGAGGAGMIGPSVLMSAVSKLTAPEKRGLATGVVNSGGSFGQFVVLPLSAFLMSTYGWNNALIVLGIACLLIIPLSIKLWVPSSDASSHAMSSSATSNAPPEPMSVVVKRAVKDRNFILLSTGFFVCGFHVAFIATHLPGVIASCGLPPNVGAWTLAVVGLFNIFGSLGIGLAMNRWRLKSLLSVLYTARAVIVLAFLMAPKTEFTFIVFAAAIGLTYLSTVPPTVGLVAKQFGLKYMATLFGIVMLTHQIGGFLGATLGGKAFELTASYNWMWYADVVLAIGAALIHLPIKEAPLKNAVAAEVAA